jgi:uncharacterized protein
MGFESGSLTGVAIMLWATDPDDPHRLVTPFLTASVAAAMDMPVEMYFTARSVRLLVPAVVQPLKASPTATRGVYAVMQEAAEHGVRFFACSEALQAHGLSGQTLIPECAGRGGVVQFMERAADPTWRTLVF